MHCTHLHCGHCSSIEDPGPCWLSSDRSSPVRFFAGRFDYLLHVAVEDLKGLGHLIKSNIAALPGFGKSETFVVLSEIKPDEGLHAQEVSAKTKYYSTKNENVV